jgi:hypothetical protein
MVLATRIEETIESAVHSPDRAVYDASAATSCGAFRLVTERDDYDRRHAPHEEPGPDSRPLSRGRQIMES